MRNLGLVFAGGGNRAFYQLGVVNRLAERVLPRVAGVAASSAGACVAVVWLSGRQHETHAYWEERRRHVHKNFEWSRLLAGQRPTPHAPIYRDTVIHAAEDGGLERLRALPFPLLVVATRWPRRLPAFAAAALGLGAYSLERRLRPDAVHLALPKRVGFRTRVFDARDCESPEELADLIIASSATPPFTPIGFHRGERLPDGGLVDNVPASVVEALPGVERSLVLLTRPRASERRGHRLYLAPTAPVPVERWDYTRPERVRATIAMGEEESSLFRKSVEELLE